MCERELGLDALAEMIGPRCEICGGCNVNVAAKWAGEQYGWCYCGESPLTG